MYEGNPDCPECNGDGPEFHGDTSVPCMCVFEPACPRCGDYEINCICPTYSGEEPEECIHCGALKGQHYAVTLVCREYHETNLVLDQESYS